MLEVCVENLEGARIAVEAGAQRIELSEQLKIGGVTPSDDLILKVRNAVDVPLIVLIRSRGGNFVFDGHEKTLMVADAIRAIQFGADGIAIGGLNGQHDLDADFLSEVTESIPRGQLVMHRAFDFVRSPKASLEQLVQLGFDRILTSGGPLTAIEGLCELQHLNEWASDRIQILPAGGVSPSNARRILESTSCRQLTTGN